MTDDKSGRLMSLDALRGADMLFIMGFSSAVVSFCAWIGLKDCWVATQMTHVAWHGFRHHDTIFPLFLFLAGAAWPFSYASQVAKRRTTAAILRKIGFRVLAGELLRAGRFSGNRKTLILLGAGLTALALTFAWRPWCPVNKKIWTATFVLASASYSFILLSVSYWIIDVKGFRKWTFFFRVIGLNSITIYVAMRFVGFSQMSRFFFGGIAGFGDKDWSAFVLAMGTVAIEWLVLLFLYRKKTFLKV